MHACLTQGGFLAEPRTREENEAIKRIFIRRIPDPWIGIRMQERNDQGIFGYNSNLEMITFEDLNLKSWNINLIAFIKRVNEP